MSTTYSQRKSRHGFAAIAASAAVILVAAGFYGYAIDLEAGGSASDSYRLRASFLSSNGLHPGADVMLAGVPVGRVDSVTLDGRTMTSLVRFTIRSEIRLPTDTRLSIGSATLTSANALMVLPGQAAQRLPPDALLTATCEPSSLEQQISRYIFGSGGAPSACGG